MLIAGGASHDGRERIEFKCSPTGNISKITPTKAKSDTTEPRYNHYYQKFRQQQKSSVRPDAQYLHPTKGLQKNKFPLPFTGVEYPLIDGGGITSSGREGIYADNKK